MKPGLKEIYIKEYISMFDRARNWVQRISWKRDEIILIEYFRDILIARPKVRVYFGKRIEIILI
jgi:hypothetical protein